MATGGTDSVTGPECVNVRKGIMSFLKDLHTVSLILTISTKEECSIVK